MTPIQQAIEQVKKLKEIAYQDNDKAVKSRDWDKVVHTSGQVQGIADAISILQSLLPVEKECLSKAWDASADYMDIPGSPDFEQYYSQFNEVK